MSVHLKLEIENVYEDGEEVTTHVEADVPAPSLPPWVDTLSDEEEDERNEWEQEHIFPVTGTGKVEGDSAYFVEVLGSSDEALIPVGTKWEFGL